MDTRFDVNVDELRKAFLNNESWAMKLIMDYISPIISFNLFSKDQFEDSRQNVLLDVTRYFQSDREISKVWGLLKTIAINKTIDANRKNIRWRSKYSSEGDFADDTEHPNFDLIKTYLGEDFETRESFLYAFQQLDKRCQQLILERFFHCLDYDEMAIKFDMSQVNTRVALSRCRKRFKEYYLRGTNI